MPFIKKTLLMWALQPFAPQAVRVYGKRDTIEVVAPTCERLLDCKQPLLVAGSAQYIMDSIGPSVLLKKPTGMPLSACNCESAPPTHACLVSVVTMSG
ncbi:hypothetical protein GN958_ATG17740 [Phytophthora infestans]|uniref:Uncharacterized protein n=1 Tax=Phytophthora infestans TaxID=4787 RepID=A0A8S9U254_PHYIN|nr:hypothetical protein GN958_ATG17740 [Phytophthora infestans]